MSIDRQADLHYAYQFGQDAARNDYQLIKAEFLRKFAGDADALAAFDEGFQAQISKTLRDAAVIAVSAAAPTSKA